MPVSPITVRTSAKSTLIRPGRVISSAMPCTAPCSTWFAALNASSSVVVAAEHRQQFLVRDRDQRVDVLAQLGDALLRQREALAAFHLERLGDDRHREDAQFLRHLRHDRRGARAGATTHAGGDEHHVAPSISSTMRSRSSIAAWRPTSGSAPAPRPLVMFEPICRLILTLASA